MENPQNSIVESRQEYMISPTADANAKPILKTAHFLKPSLTSNHQGGISEVSLPSLPSIFDPKNWPLTVHFHGWSNSLQIWKKWVHKMSSLHSPTWKKAGIYDAIFNSTFEIHQNTDLILGVAERWCPDTNSFVFPWGEATVTLEDMLIAGFSVLGSPVFEPLETEESREIEEALIRERREIAKTPGRKARQSVWLKRFMDSGSEIEHEAFLSFWLSRFVFPGSFNLIRGSVFPIAIHLARGTRIALAPAVLASIYRDLTSLNQKIVSLTALDADDKVDVTMYAPFQLVLVWVWERFVKLSPNPNLLKIGEPRFARWNNVKCNIKNARSLLDSSKESFNWRPYAKPLKNWDFPKFYREKEMWVFSDSDLDQDLLAFILCLRISELVGLELKCSEQYLPHRVARQFGFDQDLPGFVVHSGASSEYAWSCYIRPVGDVNCFIPSCLFEKDDVTTRYLDWWNTLEFHQHSNFDTNVLKEKKKATTCWKRKKKDDIHISIVEPIVVHVNSMKRKIEEINSLSVPPGFLPKCDRVEEEEDSSDEDSLTIAEILKLKQNRDARSNKKCGNLNNLSGTPESHSSPVAALVENNDHYNLIPSQSRTHSCSVAVNGDEVVDNGEDVNPENVHVQLCEGQTHSSSVAGSDQTPNYLDLQEATMEENAKQDVESANKRVRTSLATRGKNNMAEYLFEAVMGLEHRIERLEKINAARKASLYRRYSGSEEAF